MIINVDVDKLCGFLGIKKEEVNQLTIAQIEEAQLGIKEKEYHERRDNESVMNDYRFFFTSYNRFVELFGKELTDKYLPLIPLTSLMTKAYMHKGHEPYSGNPARLIGEGKYAFPVTSGRGSRSGATRVAPADIYMISADYQGIKHEQIIRPIFAELYPWSINFKMSFYELKGSADDEFYVKTELEGKSIYVPYDAFIKGDIEAIKKRNIEYFGWYYRKHDSNSEESYSDSVLNSKVAQSFFSCIKGN